MADDVKALVIKVEASVELARRNLAQLSSAYDSETQKIDGSLKRVDNAHKRLGDSSNAMRGSVMELQHVFRSFGDSVAAGQDPVRAFIMELGRVGQAAEAMGANGAMGSVGKFLGGPWGLVLSGGIALLASLAGGHDAASEAAKKHETVAQLLAKTLKGDAEAAKALAEAITAEHDAATKAIRTTEQSALAAYNEANAKRTAALAIRDKTKADLEAALAAEKVALSRLKEPQHGAHDFETLGAEADYRAAQGRVAEFSAMLVTANAAVVKAHEATVARGVPLVEERVKRDTDPSAAARGRYDDGLGRLRQQYVAGTISAVQLREAEDKLTNTRDAELKAIEERNKKGPGAATLERDAESAATRAAYLKRWLEEALPGVSHITTTAHTKYVAGTHRISDHYNGDAIDFVPPGGVGSMTKEQARNLFESAGMRIRRNASGVEQLFGPWMGTDTALGRAHQNHIHAGVEGGPPKPGTTEHRLEAAAEKAARDQESFDKELMRAQEELANATQKRALTAEQAEALAGENIEIERRQKQAANQALVAQHHRTQAQADLLNEEYREVATAKMRVAAEAATQRVIEEQAEHERVMLTGMVTLLHLQEGFTTTAAERKKVQVAILEYEEGAARAELRRKLAKEQDPATKANLQLQLDQREQQYPLKKAAINRANESPMQRYQRELNEKLGDTKTLVEEIEVTGFKGIEDDMAGAVSQALKLHGALGQVLDMIIRIGLEKGLQAIFGRFGIGGGGGAKSLIGDFNSGVGIFSGLGFATGGEPPLGKASLVGERGPELFVPKQPGIVIPNNMLGRGGGGSPETLNVVVTASEDFDVRVERTSARHVAAAAPGIAASAVKTTIRTLTRPRL